MFIFWKTKNFRHIYKIKLKIRKIKSKIRFFIQFIFHIFILIRSGTKINLILNFIKNFFKKFKNENKFIQDTYSGFKLDSHDWFTMRISVLKYYLDKCVFPPKINVLEIGSYEGRSAIFFMKYFNKINLICVDTWVGSDEQEDIKIDFKKIENNFDYNIKRYKNNITKYKDTSDNFFKLNINKNFDFVFIDGYHKYETVLNDAQSAFKLLNKGGFILFDDFDRFYYKNIELNPIYAMNSFIKNHEKNIEIIFASSQLLIKKK
jgi:SAM-dependent methyltransferase|tara:strand:+ start:2578 stop:3363 length:786 start_codon:yes stop_codon:yes gene_type:complete